MKKYRVFGTTVVEVVKEVWANNEEEAYRKASQQLYNLTEYCGNGGYDKLVGVDGSDESVAANESIEYDDCEVLEDDPDYFECPKCDDECEKRTDADGEEYWWCDSCCMAFDEDGEEIWIDDEEEDE